jgi:hypothetical protein
MQAKFTAKKAWTATPSESWIHVDPATGGEGDITLKITVDAHEGAERTGKVTVKGGNVDAADISIVQAAYVKPSDLSLKEFAQEFVKGLDVWATTIGNVDADGKRNQTSSLGAWQNVHFIPIVGNTNGEYYNLGNNQYIDSYTPWVLHIGDVQMSSSQAWEVAIRGLLNMVTAEGEAQLDAMDDRNKPFTLTDAGSFTGTKISTPSPDNKWGKNPWYEYGELVKWKGLDVSQVDVNFMLKVGAWHVVRSFIPAGSNNPLGMVGNFQQFGTSSSTLILDGYEGLISPMRELLVLMRIYKYLLDNNIEENVYTAIKDKKFDFWLYGPNGDVSAPTLKAFAKEFVKGLEVWENTVGNVDADGERNSQSAKGGWTNVHYIPIGNTNNSDFKDYGNNQYDDGKEPWVLDVNGQTVTSSQAWEIAIRGLMNLVTAEGEAFLPTMDNRNKAYTLANNAKLSAAPIPQASEGNQWGKHPWYEADDNYNGLTFNGGPVTEVDVNFMVKVGAWHVVRSFVKTSGNSPLGMIGNFQQFGTSSSTLNLEGYEGYIAPMRELLILMRIYKYILDNDIDENVYDAIKGQKFSFDLYGI